MRLCPRLPAFLRTRGKCPAGERGPGPVWALVGLRASRGGRGDRCDPAVGCERRRVNSPSPRPGRSAVGLPPPRVLTPAACRRRCCSEEALTLASRVRPAELRAEHPSLGSADAWGRSAPGTLQCQSSQSNQKQVQLSLERRAQGQKHGVTTCRRWPGHPQGTLPQLSLCCSLASRPRPVCWGLREAEGLVCRAEEGLVLPRGGTLEHVSGRGRPWVGVASGCGQEAC